MGLILLILSFISSGLTGVGPSQMFDPSADLYASQDSSSNPSFGAASAEQAGQEEEAFCPDGLDEAVVTFQDPAVRTLRLATFDCPVMQAQDDEGPTPTVTPTLPPGIPTYTPAPTATPKPKKAPTKPSSETNIGCTRTQGYWKNHPERWPLEEIDLGSITYSKEEALEILQNTPPMGDFTYILVHQLIAAKLNVANGNVTDAISQAISFADSLLVAFPIGSAPGDDWARDQLVYYAGLLDGFNNGRSGIPHCD